MEDDSQVTLNGVQTLKWKWMGLAVFGFGFFWVLGYNLVLGYGIMSNDSNFYFGHANALIRDGFGHFGASKLPFYYWFLPTILATLKILFGDAWKEGYLVLQCLISGAFFLGIYRLAEHLRDWKAGLITVALGLVCVEYLSWSRYILTDILFSSIALWFVLVLLRLDSCSWNSRWGLVVLFPLLLLVTVARPIGFLFPFAISFYLFYNLHRKVDQNWKLAVIIAMILMIAAGVLLLVIFGDNFGLKRYFNVFMEFFRDGIVIRHRPEYYLPSDVFDHGSLFAKIFYILKIVAMRFIAFWNPFIIGYSKQHLIFNGLTLFPCFVLALYAVIRNFRGQFLSIVLILFVVTLFHSLTLIDYDHRYRVPLLGFVLVLAGIGLLDGVKDVRKLRQRRIANQGSS